MINLIVDPKTKELKERPRRLWDDVADQNAVGFCHNQKHFGKLSKGLVEQHQCLEKECPLFEKYEDNPFWIKKVFKKPLKQYHKNNGTGVIIVGEKAYKTDNLDNLIQIYQNHIKNYGEAPHVKYQAMVETIRRKRQTWGIERGRMED